MTINKSIKKLKYWALCGLYHEADSRSKYKSELKEINEAIKNIKNEINN